MIDVKRYITGLTLILISFLITGAAAAQANCPAEHQINARFDNGAGWSMCWESKKRENMVLSDVKYQAAGAEPYSVFNTLRLSQLHVSYDDSNIVYNDVTQFGLGGGYVTTLEAHDCPDGRLIDIANRAGICERISTDDDSYTTASETRKSQSLSVFSTSQVGSYSYLITWKFFADGSVQPSIGAAGALQRSSGDAHSHFGRKLEGVEDKSWLSHTHNYYWQIDFDLGNLANDDQVNELQFTTDNHGRRARLLSRLSTESARAINPEKMTSWLISDGDANNAKTPGYLIEPINYGHKLVSTEPYTEFDFFVTRQNDCERFVSENAKYYPACQENILEFVNNENLINEDVVVWHRISFHHVPRNEDRQVMHSHWDGFVMEGRNLHQQSPGHSGLESQQTLKGMAAASAHPETSAKKSTKSLSGCSFQAATNNGFAVDFLVFFMTALGYLCFRTRFFRRTAMAQRILVSHHRKRIARHSINVGSTIRHISLARSLLVSSTKKAVTKCKRLFQSRSR